MSELTAAAIYFVVLFIVLIPIMAVWNEDDSLAIILIMAAVIWPVTLPLAILCLAANVVNWGIKKFLDI